MKSSPRGTRALAPQHLVLPAAVTPQVCAVPALTDATTSGFAAAPPVAVAAPIPGIPPKCAAPFSSVAVHSGVVRPPHADSTSSPLAHQDFGPRMRLRVRSSRATCQCEARYDLSFTVARNPRSTEKEGLTEQGLRTRLAPDQVCATKQHPNFAPARARGEGGRRGSSAYRDLGSSVHRSEHRSSMARSRWKRLRRPTAISACAASS